jgi:hypothetical protein
MNSSLSSGVSLIAKEEGDGELEPEDDSGT